MNVKQLIEKLQQIDPGVIVYISNNYGKIPQMSGTLTLYYAPSNILENYEEDCIPIDLEDEEISDWVDSKEIYEEIKKNPIYLVISD